MVPTGREVAYVSNSYADTLSVIDVAALEVVDSIPMDHGEKHTVERWPEDSHSRYGLAVEGRRRRAVRVRAGHSACLFRPQ